MFENDYSQKMHLNNECIEINKKTIYNLTACELIPLSLTDITMMTCSANGVCVWQVVFRTADMKPVAILSLQVERQPHIVSQTFRFNHPEHSIMKKSIRIPPLHSLLAGFYRSHRALAFHFSFYTFLLSFHGFF